MLCISWCGLLEARSDHTWEACRKWVRGCKVVEPGFLESPTVEIQTQISNWNFSGFPLECEGLMGGKLARKVLFKWAQKPSIYSQMEWYLHTLKSVQNWQCGWHECMGMYRPTMQCIKFQNDSSWNLNEAWMTRHCEMKFVQLILSNDASLLKPCVNLAIFIQNAWTWVLWKTWIKGNEFDVKHFFICSLEHGEFRGGSLEILTCWNFF